MLAKGAPAEKLGRKASTATPMSCSSLRAASTSRSPFSTDLCSCSTNRGGTGSLFLSVSSKKERGSASSWEAMRRISILGLSINVRESEQPAQPQPPRQRLYPHRRHRGEYTGARGQ